MKISAIILSAIVFILGCSIGLSGQDVRAELEEVLRQKKELTKALQKLEKQVTDLKHDLIIVELKEIGLPSDNYVQHKAMILEYSEEHEQARWVAHIILTDIVEGKATRSNDFRADPLVKTETAVQEDYFLTDTLLSGKVEYDGYGYDRGHLAPSADFRWSGEALSESYFYSNMSPQVPELNQKEWAELETFLRNYVVTSGHPLYIITAPVLTDDLPKVTRSINGISIPEKYVKIAYDAIDKKGIGFIMSNNKNEYPLMYYAKSIDDVESVLGFDVFTTLDESIEKNVDKSHWFAQVLASEVEPLNQPSLPRNHFNTVVGAQKLGKKVTVCGYVSAVSGPNRKGNYWLSLDGKFPNQQFSVMIRKEDVVHFQFDIKETYSNESICVTGKVEQFPEFDKKHIRIRDDRSLKFYQPN